MMRYNPVSILTAAAVLSLSLLPAQAATRFDGNWSVEVITEKGNCDKAYRYPVAIEDGRVRYAGPGSFDVSGAVKGNGAVTGSISRGSDTARVQGSLDARSGSGVWHTSGDKSCSGRWVGERRS